MIALLCFGKLCLQTYTEISCVMKNKIPYCNLQFVFQTKLKLIIFFTFEEEIPVFLCSGIIIKIKCGGCNVTFYSNIKCHFKFRMYKYLKVSPLPGKMFKGDNNSAIKNIYFAISHLVLAIFGYQPTATMTLKFTLMKNVYINGDNPPLNKNRHTLSLGLFDD